MIASLKGSVGVKRIIGDALRAAGPHRKGFLVLALLSFIVGILETVLLFLVARMALAVTSDSESVDITPGLFGSFSLSVTQIGIGSILILVILSLLALPVSRVGANLSAQTLVRVRTRVLHAYLLSSRSCQTSHQEGYLQELMSDYAQRTERVVQQAVTIVVAVFGVLAIAAGAVVTAPIASVLAFAGLAATAVLARPAANRLRARSLGVAQANRQLSARVAQTTRVSEEIAAFDVGGQVSQALGQDIAVAADELRRVRLLSRLTPTFYQYGTLLVVIVVALLLVSFGSGSLNAIGPLLLLLLRGLTYARQLQSATQMGNELAPYVDTLEIETATLTENRRPSGDISISEIDDIAFHNASFAYVEGQDVISEVNITIRRGESVGIIGRSGGGKTTFTQLLLQLRPPTSGDVLVNGVSLERIRTESWASLIALVPQSNELIFGTAADNIRFFRDGFSQLDVEEAARAAHLHHEITSLPEGYETFLGPGSRNLSGGQRQRLGIARALLGRPSLLVLDEPTSALDGRSEELIRETLDAIRHRTTIVVVAHRKATLEGCDRLLLVEGGAIREISRLEVAAVAEDLSLSEG